MLVCSGRPVALLLCLARHTPSWGVPVSTAPFLASLRESHRSPRPREEVDSFDLPVREPHHSEEPVLNLRVFSDVFVRGGERAFASVLCTAVLQEDAVQHAYLSAVPCSPHQRHELIGREPIFFSVGRCRPFPWRIQLGRRGDRSTIALSPISLRSLSSRSSSPLAACFSVFRSCASAPRALIGTHGSSRERASRKSCLRIRGYPPSSHVLFPSCS
jgi:hypothetical protein